MLTLGRGMLEHWLLDPECTYLNHGTVGAPPRRVIQKQQALRDEIERQPSRFMLRELNGHRPMPWRAVSRLREASDQVAGFLGSRPDDLVFVPNVTTGLNAVLGSLPLGPGDEVVITDLAYGAIAFATAAVCDCGGATLRTVHLEYPMRDAGDVVEPIVRALTPHTKLVVIDHVTAQTALVLPVVAVAAECRARGVPVLVDGAHVPGSRPLDIPSLGVDWYAANLHKWAHAPRGCGILWAAQERQSLLRFPVVSWGHDKGFRDEFEHTATADPTSYLAAPEGIALLHEWGFDACVKYMHGLAWEAADILTERWRTKFEIPRDMVGTMVTVPLPQDAGTTDADAERLRLVLLLEENIEVQLHAWRGRLWARVSAQIYNDRLDITRLADAVARRTRPA
ncbi:MAG TPA: aminotransferase class V-fold PLP-dependent enzyme [Vicinamibacterales bacterium]|nr:aminotransferase class V-fold PLP-dependent enzyme [Vicinamibacterales bacterium]